MRSNLSTVRVRFDGAVDRADRTYRSAHARRLTRRPLSLLLSASVHAALVWLVIAIPNEVPKPNGTAPMTVAFIPPRIVHREDFEATKPNPPAFRVPQSAPVIHVTDLVDVERPVTVVMGLGTMAPQPAAVHIDPATYVRDSALPAGRGATVVLRLEILASGDLGRAEVEVSGGTEAIDHAAVAYARAMPWLAGAIDGRPASMWIRWSVHLQA